MVDRRVERKIRRLREQCQRQPEDADTWHELGMLYFENRELHHASECFEKEASLRPGIESFYALGSVLLAQDQLEPAVEALEKARDYEFKNPAVLGALGTAYLRLGMVQEAKPLFAAAAEADPTDEESLLGMAKIAAREGDFWRAIELSNNVLKHDPIDEQSPLLLMGDCFLAVGGLEQAEKCYASAIELNPENVAALLGLAQIHLMQGNEARTEEELNRALVLAPERADVYVGLGNFYMAQGQIGDARAAVEKAIRIDPNHAKAYGVLAVILVLQDASAEAFETASKGLAIDPKDVDCLLAAAQSLELEKRFEEALQFAEQAVTLAPENHQAHLLLARSLIALAREPEKAMEHLVRAEELSPGGEPRDRIMKLKQSLDTVLFAG